MSGRPRLAALIAGCLLLGMAPGAAFAADDATLPTPTLVSPAPYAAAASNPMFEWKPVAGAIKYHVQVYSKPGVVYHECGGETFALRLTCDELPAGPWLWSVRATGLENRTGPYALPRPFTKLPRITTAPTITAPASGSTFDFPDDLGILRWTPVANAAAYQVEFSDTPSFPGPPLPPSHSAIDTEALVVPADQLGVTRYWRVRGLTERPIAAGPWSGVRSFKTRWTTIPALLSPGNGDAVSTMSLRWEPLIGAVRYEIELTAPDDPTFADPIAFDDSTRPWLVWDTLPSEPTFLWRVRGVNETGAFSPWSATWTVTTDPGAPAAPAPEPLDLPPPVMTSPADGATNVDLRVTPIDWEHVPGTIGYDLQIVRADEPFFSMDGQPSNTRGGPVIPNLDAGVTYQWRMRSNASDGLYEAGEWSDVRTFTTVPRGQVTLTSPANGATVTNEALLFAWNPVPNAPVYFVEVSATADFEDADALASYGDSRDVNRGRLEPGTWYWRVRAGNQQTSAISGVRSFTVVDASPPVGRVGLPGESFLGDSITLEGPAEDAFTDVARTAVSADGVDWLEFDYGEQPTWSLVSPEHGGPDLGARRIWWKWLDTAGNWSTPKAWDFWYGPAPVDTTPPAVTGPRTVGVVPGSAIASGRVPVRTTWTFKDPSGLRGYDLFRSTDGGGNVRILEFASAPPPFDTELTPGHRYRFAIQASDGALNTSPTVNGPSTLISRIGETSKTLTYRGSWTTVRSDSYWRGQARKASKAGASVTIAFKGRSIGLVSLRGPTRGAASIYVDGKKVATIDLYARTYQSQQVVWSRDWTTSGKHTVMVRVEGTLGRSRFDLDGFAITD